jgi:hypothetical protein
LLSETCCFSGVGAGPLCKPTGLAHTWAMPLVEKLDPVTLALINAPSSNEPETEEERAAVEAAKASLRACEPTYTLQELADEWGTAK